MDRLEFLASLTSSRNKYPDLGSHLFCSIDTCFTMVAIPYGATAGEITYEPKERSALMGFRMAFASLGILIGGAVIPQLAGGTREGIFCGTDDRSL